jgi:GT2 family glycosyltransferase
MIEQCAPVISVCIANYNGEAFLRECIESVLNQEDPPAFEIIVHDDASNDRSLEVLSQFPLVRVIASAHNVGFCISNNRMADIAKGNYLLLLNNDAELHPDALNALASFAQASSDDPVLSLAQFDYDTGALLDKGFLLDPFANPVPCLGSTTGERAMVMGSCLWISVPLWKRIGGFPEWIESIGEDLYLCCYARLLGHTVRVCEQSGYKHRVGSSFGGGKVRNRRLATTARRRALSERNKLFVLLIFQPFALLVMIIPLHVMFLLAEGALLALWHKNPRLIARIHIAALLAPLRRRHEILRLRRDAQKARLASWGQFLKPMIWAPWKLVLLWRHGMPFVQ